MEPLQKGKRKRLLLKIELIVCLGPTFFYLLTGVVLVPHQLRLLLSTGVRQSFWPLFYYVGVVALFLAVRTLYSYLTVGSNGLRSPRCTIICLAFGIAAVSIGPVGAFVLGGREMLLSPMVVPFLVLPVICVLHLVYLSRLYLKRAF